MNHTERAHQDGKHNARILDWLTHFQQSQSFQLKSNDTISNFYVKLPSDHKKKNRKEI